MCINFGRYEEEKVVLICFAVSLGRFYWEPQPCALVAVNGKMHYTIFYTMFTLFYSWGWTSGQSVSTPDCSSRLHYCMVENGYRAVNCKNGPVSVPSDVVTSNRSFWSVVPRGFPLCGQFGHRIVEHDQSVRSKIQSLQLKGDGVATLFAERKIVAIGGLPLCTLCRCPNYSTCLSYITATNSWGKEGT